MILIVSGRENIKSISAILKFTNDLWLYVMQKNNTIHSSEFSAQIKQVTLFPPATISGA